MVDKNDIPEILRMYEKYCRIMDITELPILTLNKREYKTALIHPKRQTAAKRLDYVFGQTTHGWKDYKSVIYLNIKKFKCLKGLHERLPPVKVKKRKRTWIVINKIGHLEETLIHELLHIKQPKLRHGDKFDSIVRNIYLKNNNITQ